MAKSLWYMVIPYHSPKWYPHNVLHKGQLSVCLSAYMSLCPAKSKTQQNKHPQSLVYFYRGCTYKILKEIIQSLGVTWVGFRQVDGWGGVDFSIILNVLMCWFGKKIPTHFLINRCKGKLSVCMCGLSKEKSVEKREEERERKMNREE